VCKRCGCTDAWSCAGGCYWLDAEHTLCSACIKEDELSALAQLPSVDEIKERLRNLPDSCGMYDDEEDDEHCQVCGCSESNRCEGGCQWVNEHKNLCSGCAVPRPAGCTCTGDWFGDEDANCALHPVCSACNMLFGEIDEDTGLLKPGKCECGLERPATSPAAEART
jgi:hypothetical protein